FALELTASDPDHDVLVLTWEVTQEPALGESSLEGSGATREVRYTPAPDVTGEDAFTITVRDPDGGSSEVDVAIIIEPVNDPPTPAVLSTMTVSENLGDNAVVGEWSAMDPEDSPEQLSFALAVGDGDDDNVLFTVDGNTLIAVENLDFEAGSELMLRVRVTDTEGATTEGPWMLQVLDTNDPPMGILLEPAEVFGDEEADTEVGTLQAQDQDVDDTHTFSFVEGEGDDDNALFTIEGAALLTTEALRASERDNYRIRVAATDGMSTVEEAITITVTDTPIAAGDSYTISMGDTLRVEAPGVLANDRPTGSVTAVLDANPTGGSLTLEEDGAFTYTPDMDFVGEDSFTYLAQRDDRMSEAATVIITVERRDMMPDTGMGDTDIPDTGLPDTDGSDTDMLDTDEPDAVSGDTDMPEPDTDGLDTATPDMGAPSDTSTGTDVTNVTTGGGSDGCTAVPFTAPVASSVWTVLMLVLGSFAVLRRRRPL
ncbi:MAG: Ig-like domain-containing protein, partial [Myxococcota bacterium]